MLCRAERSHVLKFQPRRTTRVVDIGQEGAEIVVVQRADLELDALVFLEEVHRAQYGAVAAAFAQGGKGGIERLLVDVVEDLLAEERCNLLHLRRNGGILVGEVCVAGMGVDDAQGVTAVGKVKVDLFHNRRSGVCKVDKDQTSDRRRHLVHQTRGLSEVDVFGVLSDLGNFDGRELIFKEQTVEDSADQNLESGGAGKTRAGENCGADLRVEAAELTAACLECCGNAAHKSGGRILFRFMDR